MIPAIWTLRSLLASASLSWLQAGEFSTVCLCLCLPLGHRVTWGSLEAVYKLWGWGVALRPGQKLLSLPWVPCLHILLPQPPSTTYQRPSSRQGCSLHSLTPNTSIDWGPNPLVSFLGTWRHPHPNCDSAKSPQLKYSFYYLQNCYWGDTSFEKFRVNNSGSMWYLSKQKKKYIEPVKMEYDIFKWCNITWLQKDCLWSTYNNLGNQFLEKVKDQVLKLDECFCSCWWGGVLSTSI